MRLSCSLIIAGSGVAWVKSLETVEEHLCVAQISDSTELSEYISEVGADL